jgi:hypothetical protein
MAALNSTLLHELYFASLGGDGRAVPEVMSTAIARDFGSVNRWRHEFVALANALAVGSGWVLLTWVPREGRLINQSVSDTSQGIAGGIPILALDMYSTVSSRFRGKPRRLCRRLHAQHRLERAFRGVIRTRSSRPSRLAAGSRSNRRMTAPW